MITIIFGLLFKNLMDINSDLYASILSLAITVDIIAASVSAIVLGILIGNFFRQ